MGRWRDFWSSRVPWERRAAITIAALAGIVLYVWAIGSAERARARLQSTLATLRAQAVQVEQEAGEHQRLRAVPPVSRSATDLRALMQGSVDGAGLSRSLVRIEARDANRVQVTFGAVAFAAWLAWVERLQSQQVRVDACRIEALATPGLVSAAATLVRGGEQ